MIEIVHSDSRLGEIGTQLLLENDESPIFILSNRLRWLKTNLENNNVVSEGHIQLEDKLNQISQEFNSKIYNAYNAKVVLLKNPTSKSASNKEGIKMFINAGAEVRYFKGKGPNYRVIISNSKLFFSYSNSNKDDLVVNKGFYYKSEIDTIKSDTLIGYYNTEFNTLFEKSLPVEISQSGKIIFTKTFLGRILNSFKEISWNDIVLMILGAILGSILGVLLGFLG